MKRIVNILIVILLITAVVPVSALQIDDPYAIQLMGQGYTESDIYEINAILLYSDANVLGLIIQKYEEYGDWSKVRRYYGVDEEKYENYIDGVARWQAVLDRIPDEVMSEMKSDGWTRSDISSFVNKLNIARVDFGYAWQQYKSGKTVEEIVKEKREQDKKISELDTEYVMSDMSETEYWTALSEIKSMDSMTISQILLKVKTLRTDVRNRHKIKSGITEAEMKYCIQQGLTNPMDMFRAKHISTGNNVPFANVVEAKLNNESWTEATAEALNIPIEEYSKQVEDALKQ